MKKYIFFLFIALLVSSDSLWACAESLMPYQEYDKALISASKNGHIEVVRALLEAGANVDHQDKYRYTALIWASYKGHIEIVRALLAAGANVDDISLIRAVKYDKFRTLARLLIEYGANVNLEDNIGRTALIWASGEGDIEIVRLLIEYGATVNHQSKRGRTALVLASLNGHIEVVRALLEAGANVDLEDNVGWSILDHERVLSEDMKSLLRESAFQHPPFL